MTSFLQYAAVLDRVARDALAEAGARIDSLDDATSAVIGTLISDDRASLAEAVTDVQKSTPAWFRRPASRR